MKNILIIGVGRAGKSTISDILKNKYPNCSLIHSDSLKWAMIRANSQEDYFRKHVDVQKEFEHGEYFQRTLLEFYNSLIRNDKNQCGYILETGQIDPEFVNEMIDREKTIVICLGLGDLSIDNMVEQCIKYDTEDSWTYGLSKSYIKSHAKDWYDRNKMLKIECPKNNIKYFDTSKNRNTVFEEILDYIDRELK